MRKGIDVSNTTQIRCYPHHHMTAAQYGFWDVCRSLAHKNKILFFNGRSIAERFQGMSKSTAYLLAEALTEGGWLKLVKDSTRRKDGTFSPKQYQVLSHEEWAAEHPEGCLPVPPAGLDDISPVQPADSPVQPADQPVQPAGHNLLLKLPTIKQPTTEPDNHKPVQPVGLDGFIGRFEKPKKVMRERKAEAAYFESAPVQPAGQVVRDTQAEAEWLSTAITNMIEVADPNERSSWALGIEQLLCGGYSKSEISDVAGFTHRTLKNGTLKRNGPNEFVRFFDDLKAGMIAKTNGEKTA
jgi:hypothetical protein